MKWNDSTGWEGYGILHGSRFVLEYCMDRVGSTVVEHWKNFCISWEAQHNLSNKPILWETTQNGFESSVVWLITCIKIVVLSFVSLFNMLSFSNSHGVVHSCLCRSGASAAHTVPSTGSEMNWCGTWMEWQLMQRLKCSEKFHVPVPLCWLQIPHGLPWN